MIKENKLLLGDCLDKLKELEDNSIDSIVSDPPYGLAFMGKKWDYDVPSQAIWEECMRVLKPGGHLLSFAGSRTYHRMAVRIEDAGFEIRDQIMWVYGSGFPKSHNIGKAVDKLQGNNREVVGIDEDFIKRNPNNTGVNRLVTDASGVNKDNRKKQAVKNENAGVITKGNSEWEGWGTALKPAHEPIVMARKPFKGTVADNVLEWGTGAINIDDCRIGFRDEADKESAKPGSLNATGEHSMFGLKSGNELNDGGRFPANIIFDEEAGKILDEQSGISKSSGGKIGGGVGFGKQNVKGIKGDPGFGDIGGASRFFYCPKASKKDRNEGCDSLEDKSYSINQAHNSKTLEERYALKSKNNHPTVKPTDLMQYLIRLVTKKGGVVLDPFMGSGSTGKAAIKEGMIFVGIEREREYFEIAKQRIENELNKNEPQHNFW